MWRVICDSVLLSRTSVATQPQWHLQGHPWAHFFQKPSSHGRCSLCLFKGHLPICVKSLCTTEHGTSPKDILCSSEHVIYDFVATVQSWAVVCPGLTRSLNPIPGTKETWFLNSEFISWMKLGKSRIQSEHDNLALLKCEGECNPSPTAIRTHSHVSLWSKPLKLCILIKMELHIFTFSTILHSQLLIQTQLLRYMSSVALFYVPNIHNYQVKGT